MHVVETKHTYCWFVVSTPLKNISQCEGLSHILWNIKHVPNHQPEMHVTGLKGTYSTMVVFGLVFTGNILIFPV